MIMPFPAPPPSSPHLIMGNLMQEPYKEGTSVAPIVQLGKLRLRRSARWVSPLKVVLQSDYHTARKEQNQNERPVLMQVLALCSKNGVVAIAPSRCQ